MYVSIDDRQKTFIDNKLLTNIVTTHAFDV